MWLPLISNDNNVEVNQVFEVANFLVEMRKASSVRYLLVAGAPSSAAAMRIASRFANGFGVPVSARPTHPSEPEPAIAMYISCGAR